MLALLQGFLKYSMKSPDHTYVGRSTNQTSVLKILKFLDSSNADELAYKAFQVLTPNFPIQRISARNFECFDFVLCWLHLEASPIG